MKNLALQNTSKLSISTFLILTTFVFLASCEEEVPLTPIDHLSKTWVFQSLESSTMDADVVSNWNFYLSESEFTYVHVENGGGTYTTIAPNAVGGSSTGSGTWQSGGNSTGTSITSLVHDDIDVFIVVTLNATQLHLKTDPNMQNLYEAKYVAK